MVFKHFNAAHPQWGGGNHHPPPQIFHNYVIELAMFKYVSIYLNTAVTFYYRFKNAIKYMIVNILFWSDRPY